MFIDYIGVVDDAITDIVITGSMANFNWTSLSDIDLHVVIDIEAVDEDTELVKELLDAKRRAWAAKHSIEFYGHPIELYAQDSSEPHVSTGVYSVMHDKWLIHPKEYMGKIDSGAAQKKADALASLINDASNRKKPQLGDLQKLADKIRTMRRCGLKRTGEFSVENLAFKALRNSGYIESLYDTMDKLYDSELSLHENLRLPLPWNDS